MKNQHGVTLIELLAAVTLLGIISIGIFSILDLTFRADEIVTKKINLTTETNLIMSQIKKEFYSNNSIEIKKNQTLTYQIMQK